MKALSWIGMATGVVGSFVVAMQFFLVGYCLFAVSSVSWLIVGVKRKDKPMLTMNGVFLVSNMIGLYNAVF